MNTSSRMMSFGEEQKIHISKAAADLLPKDFKVAERGQIEVKGKGAMTTCWVEDRVGRAMPIKEEVCTILYIHHEKDTWHSCFRSWPSIRPRSRGQTRRERKRQKSDVGKILVYHLYFHIW